MHPDILCEADVIYVLFITKIESSKEPKAVLAPILTQRTYASSVGISQGQEFHGHAVPNPCTVW
jgi:hypothetical protein